METLISILLGTWDMYLDAALWLVVGIVAAGLLHVWLAQGLLGKWLGGDGPGAVVKAALLGAPLPLCSCGVLPAAVGLRKDGASKGATVSFMIATPETGPDSVAVSYALLGPVMAVVRPVTAVIGAIVSGLLTNILVRGEVDISPAQSPAKCCASSCCASTPPKTRSKLWSSLTYGFVDVLDDIALWLLIGLVAGGTMSALVEPHALAEFGSGIWAMVVMVVVGIPIYVCATASTPIAAGFIAAGVSPGAALVFLLVGPATNLATLGMVGKELGVRALVGYLSGIVLSAMAAGLLVDNVITWAGIDIGGQMAGAAETVPENLKLIFGVLFLPFMTLSLFKDLKSRLKR